MRGPASAPCLHSPYGVLKCVSGVACRSPLPTSYQNSACLFFHPPQIANSPRALFFAPLKIKTLFEDGRGCAVHTLTELPSRYT